MEVQQEGPPDVYLHFQRIHILYLVACQRGALLLVYARSQGLDILC